MLLKRGVGIGAGLEVNLDEADAGQRARLAVIDVGGQGEEALEGVGDVGFNLLRRHAAIESGHHHHRHVDLGEKIDGHPDRLDDAHQPTIRQSMMMKYGILECKLRHYCAPPPLSSAFMIDDASRLCVFIRSRLRV